MYGTDKSHVAADGREKPLLGLQQGLKRQTSHLYVESLSKFSSFTLVTLFSDNHPIKKGEKKKKIKHK